MKLLTTLSKNSGSTSMTTAGTFYFIPRNDVVYITVHPACGGGGGGGTATGRFTPAGSGYGGGGGGYATSYIRVKIKVKPFELIRVIVGAGGANGVNRGGSWWDGGHNGTSGSSGSQTYFGNHMAFTRVGAGGQFGAWNTGAYGNGGSLGGGKGGYGYGGGGAQSPYNDESSGGRGGRNSQAGVRGSDAKVIIEW